MPAEVLRVDGNPASVVLRRLCPEHGTISVCIASDARFYWVSKGDPSNADCGCNGGACRASDGATTGSLGRNAVTPTPGSCETLSTCLALIEVVDSCNLACPVCYADSPVTAATHVGAPSLEDLQRRIQGVIDRKGPIEILQLSGGEPTLHPRFFDLLEWTMAHPGIQYVLLNTNGLRIAREPDFGDQLGRTARRGKFQLYLQFDGPQPDGQRELRGADLRTLRHDAIERCARLGLPITLAMTVTRANLPHVWAAIEFGLSREIVRGISFQPLFRSGRTPAEPQAEPLANAPLNSADIILAAVEQSAGKLKFEDFTPLPCGDPNCAIIGYLLRVGGKIRSVSEFIDFREVQGFLRDRVRYSPAELVRCGCESEPLGALLKRFELDERHAFRLFIKPFMDAWTWDQDRIDRCCTHVIRPDGQLDSFCRYYQSRT